MIILRLITNIVFDSGINFTLPFAILYVAGLWGMFKKSGVKSWYSLIPAVREYQLACCAGRETEGRVFSVLGLIKTLLNVSIVVLGFSAEEAVESPIGVLVTVLSIAVLLAYFVYQMRVALGLIDVYGVKKLWIWLWIIQETRWIPAMVWGWNSKYQPGWQVEDIQAEMERLATHGTATVMDEGLTVNLKERSVFEFFKKKVLLRDIHLAIPQGHMVLLLGGSGAGKTTFVNAINGYEKADAEVMLNGSNMYTQYKRMQYEVGFVPQQEMMRGKDAVINTLLDSAKLRLPIEISAEQRRKRVDDVMDTFGLTPVNTNLVEKLSGGQKKRLSISMEFISNPSLFILDEPDSGLDGVMARALFVELRKIADSGKIVIVITHTPDRVIDLFDDVIVLAKDSARTGRLAFYGSVEEARKFFGREKMEEIVKSVNRKEEGGDGLADEFVLKYAEVQNA
ncbi:MAG: ABC transporter ATP-binding protein [Oscillospiraceae bacterium]|nr:ABC transporter ATP-binding protein [Oscillospiraceae bacterium]